MLIIISSNKMQLQFRHESNKMSTPSSLKPLYATPPTYMFHKQQ